MERKLLYIIAVVATLIIIILLTQKQDKPVIVKTPPAEPQIIEPGTLEPTVNSPELSQEQKQLLEMIDKLKPAVIDYNARIASYQKRIRRVREELRVELDISETDFFWLKALTVEFKLSPARRKDVEFFKHLDRRIKPIPEAFIYATASVISENGQSAAASKLNNYFGTYCFAHGCGSVDLSPDPDLYEIEKFGSAYDSTIRFMELLNSEQIYEVFREWRTTSGNVEKIPAEILQGVDTGDLIAAAGKIEEALALQHQIDQLQIQQAAQQPKQESTSLEPEMGENLELK